MAENYIDKIEVDGVERPIRDTSGSVRYDAPQTLSDGQKTQARGNINAAPGGFGLGGAAKMLTAADNVDNIRASGWYTWSWDPTKQPAGLPDEAKYHTGLMRVDSANPATYDNVQTIYIIYSPPTSNPGDQCVIQRMGLTAPDVWNPWEWVNPPMILGTEYRTTERYLGRPVYVQLVDLGACPSSGYKDVVLADETIRAIRCTGRWSFNGGSTVPFYSTNLDCLYIGCLGRVVRITTGGKNFSEYTAQATVHYIKTTD